MSIPHANEVKLFLHDPAALKPILARIGSTISRDWKMPVDVDLSDLRAKARDVDSELVRILSAKGYKIVRRKVLPLDGCYRWIRLHFLDAPDNLSRIPSAMDISIHTNQPLMCPIDDILGLIADEYENPLSSVVIGMDRDASFARGIDFPSTALVVDIESLKINDGVGFLSPLLDILSTKGLFVSTWTFSQEGRIYQTLTIRAIDRTESLPKIPVPFVPRECLRS